MTLYIMRGLMGCGKSTMAREIQKNHSGRIVERDEIRMMLYGRYTDCDEMKVTNVQMALIEEGLRMKENVIVSDMNLRQKYVTNLIKLAMQYGVRYEIVDMTDVPLETCLRQNENMNRRLAGKHVPEDVIFSTYNKFIKGKSYPLPVPHVPKDYDTRRYEAYVRNDDLPGCVLFDLDGTMFHMDDMRGPFDEHLVINDRVDPEVREAAYDAFKAGKKIIFISGRTSGCREDTLTSIKLALPFLGDDVTLFMRREVEDAGRPDDDVKYELFMRHIAPYFAVWRVYDDRNKVVKMWRMIGVKCMQVEEGDF